MSESVFSESDLSVHDEDEDRWNLGKYIGDRNVAGERHGRGWAILPNSDQYDGQYRHGRRHGIGLYVFKGGARYYGKYRCGHRTGRGIFIYPDGSMYEGNWRHSLKHGKGRYVYANGHTYTGDWYRGLRHGVGVYTMPSSDGCCILRFKGTWQNGQRVGPFEVYFGGDDRCTILHGYYDVHYPRGPAVFTFAQCYMLTGFFHAPDANDKYAMAQLNRYNEESVMGEGNEGNEGIDEKEPGAIDKTIPTIWYSQDISIYDYSQLPQEPVPLPLSDSEVSVCSLSTAPTQLSPSDALMYICEEEGEGDECEPEIECEVCECSMTECPTDSAGDICASPCAIEIVDQNQSKC